MGDINQKIYDIATGGAASQAINEANRPHENGSQLPGRENGPADAYRHILLAAELTRKYGEDYARKLLDGHEWTGNNDGQTKSAESMDRHNNEIGIEIGNRLRESGGKWEDVVREARKKIDPDKNGETDSGKWLPPEDWKKNPIDDDTGQRMPNDDPRLKLPPEWSDGPLNPGNNDDYDPDYSSPDKPYYDPPGNTKKKTENASTIPSPVALDLDGDGIETVPVANGVLFDHAADGFAERSGWVGRDDGLLVRDFNSNDAIDSGRELFGSETLLANGSKAANGFDALREIDTNGDGVIDANDAAFSELRVWKDANSNGRTDTGELLTLTEAGVQSVNLAYTNSSYVDAYGNAHKQVGSYTTADGQTRAATDVWVKTDATYSVPTDWVVVPEDIAALPDAQGYGKVRDLHQAMAMDATGELKALVTAFTQAATPEDRDALVTQIIYRWTGVQDVDPTSRASRMIYGNAIGDARKLEALEEFMGEEWVGVWCWGTRDPNPHGRAAPVLLQAWDEFKAFVYGQLMAQTQLKDLVLQISFRWDAEMGEPVCDLSAVAETLTERILMGREAGLIALGDFLYSLKGMGLLNRMDVAGFKALMLPLGTDVAQTMDKALQGWVPANGPTEGDDVLRGTEVGDILDGRGGNDRLLGRGGNDTLIGGSGNDVLDGGAGDDDLRGSTGSDTYRFGRGDGNDTLIEDSWMTGETDRIEFKAGVLPSDVRLERVVRTVNGWQVSDDLKITLRDTGETLIVKNHFNESNRYAVEAIAFADGTLWDAETIKSRSLLGEAGNDELRGFNGRDDVLVGDAGDDVLEGGSGSDTYRFGLGDGQDVIHEGYAAGTDTVELAAGVTPADVTVRWTLQGDMAITLSDDSKLTVRGQADTWSTERGIEQLRFADGTLWDRSELASRALAATAGDDALVGGYQDDTLDGGTGNDQFQDLGGYDTYRFGTGDGQDTITDNTGRVLFKPGIDQNDVSFTRDGNDLIATVTASGDAVRIKDWLNSWQRIDRFDFDNGARLNVNDVLAKLNVSESAEILYGSPGEDALSGTEKDSTLYGREGNDVLTGGAGSDQIYGEAGDDVLDGGADRDWLYGGEGNNTYVVAPGMGLDNALGASLAVANDTVVFAPGIRPEDVSVQLGDASWSGQAGDVGYYNLVIGIGGNDALVVGSDNWDDLGRGAIQHFRFDDGTEWTLADVIARADGGKMGWQHRYWGDSTDLVGSQADDDITDYTGESVTVQARGNNDNVYLEAGNDQVSAGSGEDDVSSGAGEDLVAGESGNDNLDTGAGDDVVVFNHGDGNDTLRTGEGTDTLSFGSTVLPAMLSAALDHDGRVVLLVDAGAGGSITLDDTRIDDLPGDLERIQFIDADGKTRIFDLAGWLQAHAGALLSATLETPLAFDGTGFELTATVAPAGGLEAVAYAQSGDLFASANLANNTPSDSDDVLYGTPNGDTLDAGAGNDIALGLTGHDTILGGDGNDLIHGGDGDDVLEGNAGDDVIYGGWGADTLTGGTGNDALFGEWGGDTYVYQPGHGEVIIDDDHRVLNWSYGGEMPSLAAKSSGDVVEWDGGEGGYGGGWDGGEGGYGGAFVDDAPNILTFGPGIRPQDLRYSEQNGDLVIEFANQPGDRVILRGYEPNRATQTRSVDIIRFADGTEIVAENIEPTGKTERAGDEGSWLEGTPFADTLIGGDGDDVLDGQGGADRLVGSAGSDTYRIYKEWGSPTETLIAETWREQDFNRIEIEGDVNADDLHLAFDGRDLLLRYTEDGDAIRFAGFDPRTEGMQTPVSEISLPWQGVSLSFDELMARGVRYGDHTQDTYDINIGDGEVFIEDIAAPDAGNVLRFGPGIDPEALRANLRFEEDGNGDHSLRISYGGDGDILLLTGFNPNDVLGGGHAVDRFEFVDGTVWDYATLVSGGFLVEGDEQSNELTGTNLADRLHSGGDNDALHGGAGSDELHGGIGNDVLSGDAGDDAYVFNKGDDLDTIIDSGATDFNYIRFGTDIRPEDIRHEWDGATLVLHYSDDDAVRIDNYYGTEGNPVILALAFEDGTVVSLTEQMNRAPVAVRHLADTMATEDQDFSLILPADLFSDPDASDEIQVVVKLANGEPLPAWLSFDPVSRTLSGKPANDDVGDLAIVVEGKDHFGATASTTFNITVQNTNDAPEVGTPLSDLRALEDAAFNFTLPAGSFRDVDVGDALSYTATLVNGDPLPDWLSFDAQTGTFSGTPANGDVGSVSVLLTASDVAGAQSSQTFAIGVSNVNDAPEVGTVLANQSGRAGKALSWQLPGTAFVDVDAGDVLAYTATLADGSALPDWLAFDAASGTFSGTPASAGNYVLRVTATDLAGAQASQSFTLAVESGGGNQAPVTTADTANVIEDRTLLAWGNVLANDRDPEGKHLSVADAGIRRGEYGVLTLLSNGTYAYVLDDCSPKVQGLGVGESVTDTFNYLASDGSQRSDGALTITVQGTNDTPDLVRRLSDVQLAKGKAFSWQMPAGSFRDADRNDTLSYTATLSNGKPLPSWLKFDAATQTFSGTAPANAKGSIEVCVTASDGHGECSTASGGFKVGFGNKTVVPTATQGNEGVGNGADAPPPGHGANINDGGGTSPGQPDRKQGSGHGDDDGDPLARFLDGFKRDDKSAQSPHSALPALDRRWFEQWGEQQQASGQAGQAPANHDVERHWAELTRALNRLDAERQSAPAWSHANQGADLTGLAGWMHSGGQGARGDGVDAVSLACGTGTQLKGFTGIKEGMGKLSW
ncbi:MAG: putative Ig domain-containing protein [Rhodocyclales bacterium]|nr:putative Ig domain-containing protein [Rhodocyclales bacterium]